MNPKESKTLGAYLRFRFWLRGGVKPTFIYQGKEAYVPAVLLSSKQIRAGLANRESLPATVVEEYAQELERRSAGTKIQKVWRGLMGR